MPNLGYSPPNHTGPHHARKQAPFRDNTAAQLQQLLHRIVGEGGILFVLGDFNSRLKCREGKRTGMYSPHRRANGGRVRVLELMEEYDPLAATIMQKSCDGAFCVVLLVVPISKTE